MICKIGKNIIWIHSGQVIFLCLKLRTSTDFLWLSLKPVAETLITLCYYLIIGFITTLSGNLYYFLTNDDSKIYQVSEYGKFKLLEGMQSFDIIKITENFEKLYFKTTLYYKRFYTVKNWFYYFTNKFCLKCKWDKWSHSHCYFRIFQHKK